MAGREKGGIRQYSPFLFENALYLVVEGSAAEADVAALEALARTLGAIPVRTTEQAHDVAVSKVSHLPHMIAYALADTAIADDFCAMIAAGSLRDMTRVAASEYAFWQEVARLNREKLLIDMDDFSARFGILRTAIADGNWESVRAMMETARDKHAKLDMRGSHTRFLHIAIKDEPCALGRVATLLGERGVNIAGLRILNSREGVGGALVLEFLTEEDDAAARTALAEAGYDAE